MQALKKLIIPIQDIVIYYLGECIPSMRTTKKLGKTYVLHYPGISRVNALYAIAPRQGLTRDM